MHNPTPLKPHPLPFFDHPHLCSIIRLFSLIRWRSSTGPMCGIGLAAVQWWCVMSLKVYNVFAPVCLRRRKGSKTMLGSWQTIAHYGTMAIQTLPADNTSSISVSSSLWTLIHPLKIELAPQVVIFGKTLLLKSLPGFTFVHTVRELSLLLQGARCKSCWGMSEEPTVRGTREQPRAAVFYRPDQPFWLDRRPSMSAGTELEHHWDFLCITRPHRCSTHLFTPNPVLHWNLTGSYSWGVSRNKHNRTYCVTLSCVVCCTGRQAAAWCQLWRPKNWAGLNFRLWWPAAGPHGVSLKRNGKLCVFVVAPDLL